MVATIKDGRSIGSMEIFLMAAISRGGLNTIYALQRDADLQPGSIKKAIKDLVEDGLLERSDGAKRGRRAMALTKSGDRFLSEKWMTSLDPKREMESILRSATVALLMGDIGRSINFLMDAASEREKRQGPQQLRAPSSSARSPIEVHEEMRAVYENQRRVIEASLLRRFADELDKHAGAFTSTNVDRQNLPKKYKS